MKTTVVYHKNCTDGFTAAYLFWKIVDQRDVSYLPYQYGEPIPEFESGTRVIMVDISFPREVLIELATRCEVRVLDHHKTAKEALEGLNFCTFHMEESGASLMYEYLGGDIRHGVPPMVAYVRDHDLWLFELEASEHIRNVIQATPHNFEAYQKLWNMFETGPVEDIVKIGFWIQAWKDQAFQFAVASAQGAYIGSHRVVASNCGTNMLFSEVAHELAQHTGIGVCYWWDKDKYRYSLRSMGDQDVSAIAKSYGGGGHKNAAGFESKHLVLEWE